MSAVLGVVIVALCAYLGAAAYRLQRVSRVLRSLIASGGAFFVIGASLGPQGTDVLTEDIVHDLDILVNLGLGWVGLLFGLQFNREDLRRVPGRSYLAALTESVFSLAFIGGGLLLLALLIPIDATPIVLVVGLAAVGAASSPTTAAQVHDETSAAGRAFQTIRVLVSIDAFPSIAVVVVLFAFAPPPDVGPAVTGVLRIGIALGLGAVLGLLFHLLTLYRYTEDQLLVVLLGAVVFGGGAAHYLGLSPLAVSVIIGATLANLSPARMRMTRVFVSIEKPVYLVLFALAGAMWHPPAVELWAFPLAFVALRLTAKLTGGALATPVAGVRADSKVGLGRGLLGHGGMCLAIALQVSQTYGREVGDIVLVSVFLSVVTSALVAPRALRRLVARREERV